MSYSRDLRSRQSQSTRGSSFGSKPEFKIAFCLNAYGLSGDFEEDGTARHHPVDALYAIISANPDEVVVLLRHPGHNSNGQWLTQSGRRPQEVLQCPRCSQAAEIVFDAQYLSRLMVEWNCFIETAATWALANPHFPATVEHAVALAETRWHELNRYPGDRHVCYPYSWQEVMERHGHVTNQRSFAFHRGDLRKVQNRIIECQRSVAERMESVRRSMRRIGREGADTNVGA